MPNNVKHGKRLYKQMALEVAVRNPERYKGILEVFSHYEGFVLNDENILEIYANLFTSKVIESSDLDVENSNLNEIKRFIIDNLHHQNEWGFPSGYQAAFTRYLKTLSELGLIYSQYNDELKISEVAKAWLSNKIEDAEVFSLQCMRFWRKSPYRRVLNDFNYFSFILKVLLKLREKGKSLSYPQFILSLFSENGDVDEFIKLISSIKLGHDIDKTYQFIVKKYDKIDSFHGKVAQKGSVCRDYANTVFRVLQITGLISINTKPGILTLTINDYKIDLLNKLLKMDFTLSEDAKENEELYFEEIGSFNECLLNLIISSREVEKESVDDYNEVLSQIVSEYNLNEEIIKSWIKLVAEDKKEHSPFWYIQSPLKFEFFVSLLAYVKFGQEMKISPNYKTDTNGIPYQHAPGNIGDILVTSNTINWLIEVTLIRNKIQQINNETSSCIRHFDKNANVNNYLSFVAPVIHPDTLNYYNNEIITTIMNRETNTFIFAFDVYQFISNVESKSIFDYMVNYKKLIQDKMRNALS